MSPCKWLLPGLALLGALAQPALAQTQAPPDLVNAGRDFARLVCAACHVVTREGGEAPVLQPPAPSFVELARRPSLTEPSLRAFLASDHGRIGPAAAMPNPRLADYQVDKIVAYLMSLKAAP